MESPFVYGKMAESGTCQHHRPDEAVVQQLARFADAQANQFFQNIVKIIQNQIVIFWMILKLDFLWISARMGIRKQHLFNRHREIRLLQLVDFGRQGVRCLIFIQADMGL